MIAQTVRYGYSAARPRTSEKSGNRAHQQGLRPVYPKHAAEDLGGSGRQPPMRINAPIEVISKPRFW